MKKRILNGKKNLAASLYNPSSPVLSRSSKLHRKRGYLCGTGACPNCMMRVNGVANVRACQYTQKECEVESQNDLPLVDSVNLMSHLHRFISAGFQYRRLYSSPWKRKLFYSVLKRASGLGRAPTSSTLPIPKRVPLETEMLIVGGGAAGLGAAIEASKKYDRILLVDQRESLGGEHGARWGGTAVKEVVGDAEKLSGLISQVEGSSKITVLKETVVVGYYRLDNLTIGCSPGSTYEITAEKAIAAVGSHEVLPMFVNNDSPRVMLSSAAQMLANSGAALPSDTLVVDMNGLGPLVAADLQTRGVRVKGLSRPWEFLPQEEDLGSRYGVKTMPRSLVRRLGDSGGVELMVDGRVDKLKVSGVVVCGRYQPNFELPAQMGCGVMFELSGKRWPMKKSFPNGQLEATVAGSLVGFGSFEECSGDGGASVSEGVGRDVRVNLDPDPYLERAYLEGSLDTFVCLCEDVSMAEVKSAASSGYGQIESLKRFTGAVTGPCQGKQCALTVASILAMADKGAGTPSYITTVRQPFQSVPFAQLAAE